MADTLTIETLGARGDGTARSSGKPVFVPFTLPGETIRLGAEGAVEIVKPSPERVDPACKHFGECGGCKLQHMAAPAYRAWKRDLVREALAGAGITHEPDEMETCDPRSRRRAVFSAYASPEGLLFGFQQAGTNRVVAIDECHIITPALDAARPALAELAALTVPRGKSASVSALDTMTGLDISIEGRFQLDDGTKRAIVKKAGDLKFARVTVNTETLVEHRRPVLRFGAAIVAPPPGGFVQAVQATEQAMVGRVYNHLSGCKRVADLFCGAGTFSIPLSAFASVHAAESDGASLAGLERGWREAAPGNRLREVTTEKRDLFMRPMMAKELEKFQGVVFDPPRAGAEAQARELAASRVKRIAAVSCNPQTLARDLKILIDGGYTLVSVTPFDQFLWTPHVEAVALLQRGKG